MCGIVGYLGTRDVVPLLIEGLARLEYRGYDSAGVVTVDRAAADDGDGDAARLRVAKAAGKLDQLRAQLDAAPLAGGYGLGHTRWATHGKPITRNAHPMVSSDGRVALIHNGIIENYLTLKEQLTAGGWTFGSDTDTEVIVNRIAHHLGDDAGRSSDEKRTPLLDAVLRTVGELDGMYAVACVDRDSAAPEIVAARQGPPLLIGLGDGEIFLASDAAAVLAHTRRVIFLENGDVAHLRADGSVTLYDAEGASIERPVHTLHWDLVQIEKGGYKHFMLKEIHEQPQALQDTLAGRVDFAARQIDLPDMHLADGVLTRIERVQILACGTSWHSGLVGKFLIESLAGLPVEVDYGSEYRYRDPIVDDRVLAIGISQSGETADTLSALEAAKAKGGHLIAVTNVVGSQITRTCDGVLYTHAGPEIGVASTKAFTTQLEALYLLALYLRQQRGQAVDDGHLRPLAHLPQAVSEALAQERRIKRLARRYARASDFLFLGRGINYPIALEGALKLKEISYIHAEGYPAGEMKHGPIALVDEELPVVSIATGDHVIEKMRSNIHEIKARDGIVLVVTDQPDAFDGVADEIMAVPSLPPLLQPIVNVVPLQLLSYHIGVRRGCDVDQPRNLAKSVTVE
ncbi:MAG: glutamine--fructose-6-phosphate transaminase (isomerizing) [Acidobacteriota bacterium]